MIRSFLLGLAGGARAITPLAAVTNAARTRRLPENSAAPKFLGHPLVSAGATALAVYELAGDKQPSAPDRIILPAVIVRSINAGFAGAMVVPRERRWAGAAIGAGTAALSAYVTWRLRMRAMRDHSQTLTGFVEDTIVVPTAIAAAAVR